jgi:hypothetical protein
MRRLTDKEDKLKSKYLKIVDKQLNDLEKKPKQTKAELMLENRQLRELGSNYALQLEQNIKQLQIEKEYSKKFEEKSNHYFELATTEAEENAKLKAELAEKDKQLQNAVFPKFKVGDEVWHYNGIGYIYSGIITKTKITNSKKIQYSIMGTDNQLHTKNESDLSLTKSEAEEALKKLEESNVKD